MLLGKDFIVTNFDCWILKLTSQKEDIYVDSDGLEVPVIGRHVYAKKKNSISTREYNVYLTADKKYLGDVIDSSGWHNISAKEAKTIFNFNFDTEINE